MAKKADNPVTEEPAKATLGMLYERLIELGVSSTKTISEGRLKVLLSPQEVAQVNTMKDLYTALKSNQP